MKTVVGGLTKLSIPINVKDDPVKPKREFRVYQERLGDEYFSTLKKAIKDIEDRIKDEFHLSEVVNAREDNEDEKTEYTLVVKITAKPKKKK